MNYEVMTQIHRSLNEIFRTRSILDFHYHPSHMLLLSPLMCIVSMFIVWNKFGISYHITSMIIVFHCCIWCVCYRMISTLSFLIICRLTAQLYLSTFWQIVVSMMNLFPNLFNYGLFFLVSELISLGFSSSGHCIISCILCFPFLYPSFKSMNSECR